MSSTSIEAHVGNASALKHVLHELEKIFKQRNYVVGNTIEQIMYEEGQQQVLTYIRTKLVGA